MISAVEEQWRRGTRSILVVDDDESTREIITEALRDGGYGNTREVESGLLALEVLREGSCDLVITDMKMPGMTGLDLINHIKQIDQSIPVIIITAYPTIDLTVAAMKEGAIDFLTKPFRLEDLLFKVSLYLREQSILDDDTRNEREAHWKLNEKVRELSTIKLIGERIGRIRGMEDDDIFLEIAKLALSVTTGGNCLIALFDEVSRQLYKKTFHGKESDNVSDDDLLEQLAPFLLETATTGRSLVLNGDRGLKDGESLLTAPLMIRDKIFGILAVLSDDHATVFTHKELANVQNLADRASLHLENSILYESLFSSIMNTFESLIQSVQVRDNYTERHSRSVTRLALMTSQALGCSSYESESLRISAHLHDVGKIAIPDRILLKPGRLTDDEYAVICTHSTLGEDILKSIALFDRERKIVRHHHERWDGSGYPDGLAGEDIPLLARILSVADTFDAMTTDRPYRRGVSVSSAMAELERSKWTQLDGTVVDAFISIIPQIRTTSV